MKVVLSKRTDKQLSKCTPIIVKQFFKQVDLLKLNQNHPSLRSKKYSEKENVWQARINRNWRFYFKITGNIYLILEIIPHPK